MESCPSFIGNTEMKSDYLELDDDDMLADVEPRDEKTEFLCSRCFLIKLNCQRVPGEDYCKECE